ncbi:SoxR reducing system RseC family protein [Aestuariibacter sp. A3R04]|uniref:SoxR reducing system RseC family protein n=1 Tax=Aestuariibacter sp. A3R04 TaxID=2841571 RepID=UPI001C0A233E|nr:SoxR reducing system RseC family protein [Aestuariibacter sp. A3R04]MBU3021878.1 SoxR reducing system RseC family protein [Aestuariibacter sp. A3R04]
MIKESAVVVAVQGDEVTVEAAVKTTCSTCQAQSECGTGAISRAMSPRTQRLTLHSPVPCHVGQLVTIGVPEAGIMSASAWLYVVPLVVLLTSAIIFDALLPVAGFVNELWTLACSAIITFITFVVISGFLKRADTTKYKPVILTAISHSTAPER